MKYFRKRMGILLMFILAYVCLWSAYLTDLKVTVVQPDGTAINCLASGDEYHNWLHDENDYTIIRSPETGFYCYAEKLNNKVVASEYIVGRVNPKNTPLQKSINISEDEYKQRRRTKFPRPEFREAPTTGTINNIVIFIRLSD
ncbi:MAG: hypothetical protein PHR06_15990 [Candidatus Cloacimonetes bacterium]|nr:hypothetical protein [Candidatus Cloacimonadota bacterium]